MRWAEITVETTPQAQDAVANVMMENGCGGIAIGGETSITIRCYLPVDDRLEDRLLKMKDGINRLPEFGLEVGPGEIKIGYVEEQDWAESWKQYFHTTRVGKKIVIKPTWEEYTPERGKVVVELDPGMAFGTGTHPTTRLCLQALEKYMKPRKTVVDFGTGSGILAIAAAKLRASLVIAFDSDPIAVQAARANVRRNGLEEIVEVHQTDNPAFIGKEVDIVTANIVAETIIAGTETIAKLLRIGGVLIASGITKRKAFDVEQSLRNEGFDIAEKLTQDEWVAIVAIKSS